MQTGRRNDDENATEKLYTYVSHIPVSSFKVLFFSLYAKFCLIPLLLGPTNGCCGRGVIRLLLHVHVGTLWLTLQRNQKQISCVFGPDLYTQRPEVRNEICHCDS